MLYSSIRSHSFHLCAIPFEHCGQKASNLDGWKLAKWINSDATVHSLICEAVVRFRDKAVVALHVKHCESTPNCQDTFWAAPSDLEGWRHFSQYTQLGQLFEHCFSCLRRDDSHTIGKGVQFLVIIEIFQHVAFSQGNVYLQATLSQYYISSTRSTDRLASCTPCCLRWVWGTPCKW